MRRLIALLVTLSLTTPGYTTDDDRYTYTPVRLNDYQYKPQNNYSPSNLLERQIGNQNAMMRLRFGTGGTFQPSTFNLSNVNGPTWAAPKFQFTPPEQNPLDAMKLNLPKPKAEPPAPKGFWAVVGAGVKGVVGVFARAVEKVGQALGAVKAWFTVDKAKITYEAQRDNVLKNNPALRERTRGVFEVAPGQQMQHGGQAWEAGSTFRLNEGGKGIHLEEGVTMSPDLGGLRRADGAVVPVRMTVTDGRLTPMGIDWARVEPRTQFIHGQAMVVDGVGTIPAGAAMTYEGPKAGDPDVHVMSYDKARIENPDKALEAVRRGGEPISLTRMEVRLKGAMIQINGMHVKRGEEKIFVSRYGEAFSVSALEQKTATTAVTAKGMAARSKKLGDDINGAVAHVNALLKGLNEKMGTPNESVFQVSDQVQRQFDVGNSLNGKVAEVNRQMAQEKYPEVANSISNLENAQTTMGRELEDLAQQAEALQSLKRALKGMAETVPGSKEWRTKGEEARKEIQGMGDRGILNAAEVDAKVREIDRLSKGLGFKPETDARTEALAAADLGDKSILNVVNKEAPRPSFVELLTDPKSFFKNVWRQTRDFGGAIEKAAGDVLSMGAQVAKSDEAKASAGVVLTLFPGTMPVVVVSEILSTPESRASAERATEKYLMKSGVTLSYGEKNETVSRYYHGVVMEAYSRSGGVREVAATPSALTVESVSPMDAVVQTTIESFAPIIGPVIEIQKSVSVGKYKEAGATLGVQVMTDGPDLILKTVGSLPRTVSTSLRVVGGVAGVLDVFGGIFSVGGALKNREDAKLVIYATNRILAERFESLVVPPSGGGVTPGNGTEKIYYPSNVKAQMRLTIGENERISLSIPIGEPNGKIESVVVAHPEPITVRNYYGIDMDLPELYDLTQSVGQTIRTLKGNNWQPMGLPYEKEILDTHNTLNREP